MQRAPQKRRLETRQRLIETSRRLVEEKGYAGYRVEEVVKAANVAKGTFFSHFDDRDTLLALLIGEDLERIVKDLETISAPAMPDAFCEALTPLIDYMAQSREVFDIIIRNSGALSLETIGPISQNFGDQVGLFAKWIAAHHGEAYRGDVAVDLLAEGVQAFMIQAVSLKFCALHNARSTTENFRPYLAAWLTCGSEPLAR